MKVLVTGATGLVGRALVPVLIEAGHDVVATSRVVGVEIPGATVKTVGELGPDTDWRAALDGVYSVVHLAARVHVMDETATDPLAENRRINTQGTIRLAGDAAAVGVNKFIFLSTVKVMGEETTGEPFRDTDIPRPRDPYAIAKREAEQQLTELSADTGMAVSIFRPPLVYGPGVGGNFVSLLKLCGKSWPLPLGAVDNRRSLLYVGNLADAICAALATDAAKGKTWLISDGAPVSTAMLIDDISAALERAGMAGGRPGLWSVPPGMLRVAAALIGKSAAASRLLGDLCVDDGALRRDLGWTPPFSMVQGLQATAQWFAAVSKKGK